MTNYEILGVRVSNINLTESIKCVNYMLNGDKKHYIVTPNPEFVVSSLHNDYFRSVLNGADLSLADGFGLLFASKYLTEVSKIKKTVFFPLQAFFMGVKVGILGFLNKNYLDVIKEGITGVDFVYKIFENFSDRGISVYFVGTRYQDGLESAKMAEESVRKLFPNINIVGSCSGRYEESANRFNFVPVNIICNNIESDLKKANLKTVDFIFVAFGQVRQELWIKEHIEKLPCKIFIGVGGAFDFISGRRRRAPKLVRSLKLEWLFRLLVEPSLERLVRIFTAFPYFPILVYLRSLKK